MINRTESELARLRLERLLWAHLHSSQKLEDDRGRRCVIRDGTFRVLVTDLTNDEIVRRLPVRVRETMQPERVGVAS